MKHLEVVCLAKVAPLLRQVDDAYATSLTFDDEFGQVLVVLNSLGELGTFFDLVTRSWEGKRLERAPVAWLDGIARGVLRDLVSSPSPKKVAATSSVSVFADEKQWPNLKTNTTTTEVPPLPVARLKAIGANLSRPPAKEEDEEEAEVYGLWSSPFPAPLASSQVGHFFGHTATTPHTLEATDMDFSYFSYDFLDAPETTNGHSKTGADDFVLLPCLKSLVSMLGLGEASAAELEIDRRREGHSDAAPLRRQRPQQPAPQARAARAPPRVGPVGARPVRRPHAHLSVRCWAARAACLSGTAKKTRAAEQTHIAYRMMLKKSASP
jgi:hypothetical protein